MADVAFVESADAVRIIFLTILLPASSYSSIMVFFSVRTDVESCPKECAVMQMAQHRISNFFIGILFQCRLSIPSLVFIKDAYGYFLGFMTSKFDYTHTFVINGFYGCDAGSVIRRDEFVFMENRLFVDILSG